MSLRLEAMSTIYLRSHTAFETALRVVNVILIVSAAPCGRFVVVCVFVFVFRHILPQILLLIRTYLGHYAFAILLRLAILSPLSLPSPLPLPFSIRGRIGRNTRAAPRDKVIKACG